MKINSRFAAFFIALACFATHSFAWPLSPWGIFGAKTYDDCISQSMRGETSNLSIKLLNAKKMCGLKFDSQLNEECFKQNKCTDSLAKRRSKEHEEIVRGRESGDLYFNGDKCINDCSGHIAGFKWAKGHIENKSGKLFCPNDCYGNSKSFIEGCRTFINNIELSAIENGSEYGYKSKKCSS